MNKKAIATILTAGMLLGMVPAAYANAEEEIKLEMLSLKVEEGPCNAFDQMIAKFQETHPNVTIEVQTMNSDDLKTTMRARSASGDMPDIVTWMKEFEPEFLVDLSGEAFMENLNADTVAGANAIYADGQYAMPIDNGYIGVFYNRDVLEANEIEVPSTYDELLAACEKLQANGVVPFASSLSDLSVPYIGLIGLFAETVYGRNPSWSAERDAKQHTFVEDENWKAAFDMLISTVYNYGDPDNAYNNTYDDCMNLIASGECAFLFEGAWSLSSIRTANPDANIGIVAFPISNDPQDAKLLAFPDTSLSICAGSENVEIAKEFLAYVSSQEAGIIWSENVAVSSAVKGVSVDYDPIAADIDGYLSSGNFVPYGDRVLRSVFTDKLWETYSYYMLGEEEWEDFAGELDVYWDKAYEEAQAAE